jgi:hypothetical protein
MKKSILVFSLILSAVFSLVAQNSKFEKAMQAAITALDSAKTPEQFLASANTFSRIATAEPTEWLPNYYAAYANLMAGFETMEADMAKAQGLIDAGQVHLDKAKTAAKQAPELSEIAALQAFIYTGKVSENPMQKGAELSQAVFEELGKATGMNPQNPRAPYLQGLYTLNMPEFLGGGAKNAKPFIEKATALFDASKNNGIQPHWGKGHNQMLLRMVSEPQAKP